MGLHSEANLDRRFVEMMRQLNAYLNHFPKHEKYGLALEIRRAAYDLYGFIVEAQKRYQKKTSLTNMDIRHEQLRMFVRLAHELGYFEFMDGARSDSAPQALAERRYVAISGRLDEIGRMIGGWIAADRDKSASRELS